MNAAAALPQTKPTPLSPTEAWTAARRSWITSLAVCIIGLVVIVAILLGQSPESADADAQATQAAATDVVIGNVLIGVAVAWLVLAGPVVFLLRSYCFGGSWSGRAVEPGSYLKGMSSVWGVLTVGAMLALVGAAVAGQVMPGGLVTLVATMVLGLVGPDRKALGLTASYETSG